jgi:hypothetical protein
MDPAPTTTPATPASATASPAPPTQTSSAKPEVDFTKKLAAELDRIASHATKIETLKNGAKLYHLAGGREVEAAPGKSPYVVAKGDWGEKKPAAAQPETTAPATPATAPPTTATTTPPATATTTPPAATTTPPPATATPPPTATTGTTPK